MNGARIADGIEADLLINATPIPEWLAVMMLDKLSYSGTGGG